MISVIIPVYNVELFLDRCIRSIIEQSYQDIEIILIDDGSLDSSGQICDKWVELDTRISVIHKINQGLSSARNSGIKVARGEYITFIDSDDFILPDYLSYLYDLIKRDNSDISVCQLLEVDERDKILRNHSKKIEYLIEGSENCMNQFLTTPDIDTTAWRKLYKTTLFRENNIEFPIGKYHEDVFTTYKLISNSKKIQVGGKALYAYRRRSGSIVNSKFTYKHLDGIKGKIERYKFISAIYPQLKGKAAMGIVASANQCILKIANSQSIDEAIIKYIQTIYRKFGYDYVKSRTKISSKFVVLMAMMSVKSLIICYRKIFKYLKK